MSHNYKIADLRKKKGLTQAELAEKSGVSRATICAIENGTNKGVSTTTLTKLADALGVKAEKIFYA